MLDLRIIRLDYCTSLFLFQFNPILYIYACLVESVVRPSQCPDPPPCMFLRRTFTCLQPTHTYIHTYTYIHLCTRGQGGAQFLYLHANTSSTDEGLCAYTMSGMRPWDVGWGVNASGRVSFSSICHGLILLVRFSKSKIIISKLFRRIKPNNKQI